jgi:alcohol dehydrogenase YqhD (iron-dependent ADH family)
VGGGSVIDSSKSIGYGLACGGDPWDFNMGIRKPTGCAPIGVVLTIAAAGSEMSNSCVITNEETGIKKGCNSEYCRAKFAVLNPELTVTLPWYQTACGCVDIMMHTMERYFTPIGNLQLTDEIAEGLMRTVYDNAIVLHENPDDVEARAEIMWAGSLSHNGLTGCGNGGNDFASHALEHELSAAYDVTHGAGLAAIWPHWARYVMDACLDRFVLFAMNVMGIDPDDYETLEDAALAGIEAVEDFYREIEMPTNLHELGLELTDDDLAAMAHQCATLKGGTFGAAKKLTEEDALAIYRMANA